MPVAGFTIETSGEIHRRAKAGKAEGQAEMQSSFVRTYLIYHVDDVATGKALARA